VLAVLGPVAVEGPAGVVPVSGRKTREVLALLALTAPRPITAAALADRLWDDPPPSAIKTVQAHVSRARTALAAAGGARLESGYRIAAGPAELDVLAVEDLRRRARVAGLAGHDHDAAGWLAEARRRWRGEPELPATHAGDAERARLAEEHLLLVEDHLAAEVAAGRPATALPELQALTAAHPLRERLWGLAITALYRCGRQADAVAAYQAARRHLREEVGMEPGPQLRALAQGVLRHTLPVTTPPAPRPRELAFDGPHYADAGGRHVAWVSTAPGPWTCCCSTRRSSRSTPTARRRTSRTRSADWRRAAGCWRSTAAGWACPTRSSRTRRRASGSGWPTRSPCWTRRAWIASTCWPTPTPG
jgi:DNA-binding SARP family transcriptional activator